MSNSTHAEITFNEFGLPVATHFDDIYFTNENGLAESNYVFIQHNDLLPRWQIPRAVPFVIAETGFGTGLNLLACWQLLLEQAPEDLVLHFISFEKFPLRQQDLAQALTAFPQLATLADELLAVYPPAEPGCHRRYLAGGRVILDLWIGDISDQLPSWLEHAQHSVDAWFLDGFAPDKNPAMWQQHIYDAMATSTAAGGTFATFTAAGDVRRGLQKAGFEVTKDKGFGRKREMLYGQSVTAQTAKPAAADRPVTIIGGGIAAACLAHELQRLGRTIEIISCGVADAASGNSQGAIYPLLHAQRSPLANYFSLAFDYARHFYTQTSAATWHPVGVVQLGYTEARAQRYEKITRSQANGGPGYDSSLVQLYSAEQTQQLWQHLPACPSLYYPNGGWLAPARTVEALLNGFEVTTTAELTSVTKASSGSRWQLEFANGKVLQRSVVILACGAGLRELLQPFSIGLQNVRGQVTEVRATKTSADCPLVVCYKGYFTPVVDHKHCVGATYERDGEDLTPRAADQQENLQNLVDNLAPASWPAQLEPVNNRAAVRNTTKDHLPLVGEIDQGLWVLGGLGSRGFTAAPLAANALASALTKRPLPLPAELWQRLQPQRLLHD